MLNKFKYIKDAVGNGEIFGVEFIKADNTVRRMTCRRGVKKGVISQEERRRIATEEPDHIMRVWEMTTGKWKSVNLNTITRLSCSSGVFEWADNEDGTLPDLSCSWKPI